MSANNYSVMNCPMFWVSYTLYMDESTYFLVLDKNTELNTTVELGFLNGSGL